MLQWRNSQASLNAVAQAAAISKSQAVIEFEMDGTIITANRNFLDALGYRLEEIKGKHHSMFVAPDVRDGAEYRKFWADLNRGEFQSGEYKRLGKGGNEVWIQASYNPVLDRSGKPCRVIKFASDITAKKLRSMEDAGKIAAIGRAQAVIEFNLDGTIITANDAFLKTLGYSLAEIQGKHHGMFVSPEERNSDAYREFWAKLNRGEFQSGGIQALRQGRQGGLDPRFLQSDPRRCRQALQGGEVRHRCQRTEAQEREFRGSDRGDRQVAGGDRVQHGRHGAQCQREFPGHARLFARRDPGQAPQHVRGARRAQQRGLSRILGEPQPRRISVGRIPAARQGRQGSLDPGLLQSDPGPERQAVQGGEIRHRHHRAGDRAQEERCRARHDGAGRGGRRGAECIGARNLRRRW